MQARPHPSEGPCLAAGSAGAVALLGAVFVACDSQAEALELLGVEVAEAEGVVEPEPEPPPAAFKLRGEPPAWMGDPSLLPKRPP
jgi:hypothetical protein